MAAVDSVLRTSRLSLGPKLAEFERGLANYVGTLDAVAVNSGTSALHLCLRVLGVGEGHEVILPSFAFIAVANAVRYVNAVPVFVDIDPGTLNLDPRSIESAVTSRTRAILLVHTFGVPAAIDSILELARRHSLYVIEDACEALGAEIAGRKVGSFGDAGVFGFYPNKQITTGEGGALLTSNPELAALARTLRNQGRSTSSDWLQHAEVGYNFRISEMNCALGLAQLQRIDEILLAREYVAREYGQCLKGSPFLDLPKLELPRGKISWFVYVVRLAEKFTGADRDSILQKMRDRGIECGRYFAPIHLQPAYASEPHRRMNLKTTESIAPRTLALPFFTRLTPAEVQTVSGTLLELLENYR